MIEALNWLIELSIANALAIGAVAVLRRPVRRLSGAAAAYWLWLFVPAAHVAVLLPVPDIDIGAPVPIVGRLVAAAPPLAPAEEGAAFALTPSMLIASPTLLLVLWAGGALFVAWFVLSQHRAFLRVLQPLSASSDGTWRSIAVRAPLLVGVWRPKVVVPADFETRYGVEERALMIAHERAHARRGDSLVNALAAVWLSLSWFNPFAYWAIARLRFDQDLACDAAVLAGSTGERRRYAAALLAAQLASERSLGPAFACHWLSTHPLQERLTALKRPFPSTHRHRVGVVVVCAVVTGACAVLWQSAPRAQTSPAERGSASAQAAPAISEEYIIRPGDMLLVVVEGEEVLSRTVRVRPDGKFSMPLIADVSVIGKTPSQVAFEIENGLRAFLQSSEVDVIVQELAARSMSDVKEIVVTARELNERGVASVAELIDYVGGLSEGNVTIRIRIACFGRPRGLRCEQ